MPKLSFKSTPKPCPVCYTPMKKVKRGWECPRHGLRLEVKE